MQPESAARGNQDVLVVDDDPAICEIVKMALEDDGWNVRTARRGADAAREVRARRPALLILDVHLGDGSERELIFDALAAAAPIVPVLVISGDAEASQELRKILGASGYLPKPFDLDELYAAVQRLIHDPSDHAPSRTSPASMARRSRPREACECRPPRTGNDRS